MLIAGEGVVGDVDGWGAAGDVIDGSDANVADRGGVARDVAGGGCEGGVGAAGDVTGGSDVSGVAGERAVGG